MKTSRIAPRSIKTMPGIARIGRLLVAAFALFIFLPDSSSTGPIAPVEQFLPGLIGLTLLGLLIAWRRKLLESV